MSRLRPSLVSFQPKDLLQCALLDVVCHDVWQEDTMPLTRSVHDVVDLDVPEHEISEFQWLNDANAFEWTSRVLLFGTTLSGHSVAWSLTDYQPSLLVEVPHGLNRDSFELQLKKQLGSHVFDHLRIEYVSRKRFYGYIPDKKIPTQAALFQYAEIRVPSFHASQLLKRKLLHLQYDIVNQSLKPETAFCNEVGLVMSGWFALDATRLNDSKLFRTRDAPGWSTCQIEVDTSYKFIQPLSLEAHSEVPPWIALSFDCEMMSFDGMFPAVAKSDYTSCLCASVWSVQDDSKHEKHAFFIEWQSQQLESLSKDASLHELILHPCKDSAHLIEAFRDFLVEVDADLVTGWNIYGFDMPFLFQDWTSYFLAATDRGTQGFCQRLWQYVNPSISRPLSQDLVQLTKKTQKWTILQDILKKHKVSGLPKNPLDWPETDAFAIRKALAFASQCAPQEWNPGKTPTRSDLERFSKDLTIAKEDRDMALRFLGMQSRGPLDCRGLYWNRIRTLPSHLEVRQMTSAAKGDNTYSIWSCVGRVTVDLMQIIKDDKKPESNSLRFAAETFLDASLLKKDLSPQEMFDHFASQDPVRVSILLDYCARDAEIPMKLIQKLSYMSTWIEMSRVTFTSLSQVLNGGQQRKVFNVIARFVHGDYVINKRPSGWPIEADFDNLEDEHDADPMAKRKPDYQGATVIEPEPGHYETPVSVLDFESLYPSIIIFFNLCASNLVLDPIDETILQSCPEFSMETHSIDHNILIDAKDMVYKTETRQYTFVKHVAGVMPRLLRHLLKSRKAVKALMALEKDPFMKAVLNGRQNGLKIVCNSVYGFCGVSASKGLLPCKPVAAVTTLKGRSFIDAAKQYVEQTYVGSKVLYGDSVSPNTAMVLRRTGSTDLLTYRMDEIEFLYGSSWAPFHDTKESIETPGLETWTSQGWSPIHRLIRHKLHASKKMFRILTHTGVVDCTEDHSLVLADGSEASPRDVFVGTHLLHGDLVSRMTIRETSDISVDEGFCMGLFMADGSCDVYDCPSGSKASWAINKSNMALLKYAQSKLPFESEILDTLDSSGVYKLVPKGSVKPHVIRYRQFFYNQAREKIVPSEILNGPIDVVQAFWDGFYAGDGDKDPHGYTRFDQRGKQACQGLYILARRLGFSVSINDRASKFNIFRLTCTMNSPRKSTTAIKRMYEIPIEERPEYVYDLETSNHHFSVGPGDLIVHNTDSIMIRWHMRLNDDSGNDTHKEPKDGTHMDPNDGTHKESNDGAHKESNDGIHKDIPNNEKSLRPFTIPEAYELGEIASKAITERLRSGCALNVTMPVLEDARTAVTLANEKVYCPYLLIKKKNYAGIKWTPSKHATTQVPGFGYELDMKGIDAVRRDRTKMVRELSEHLLQVLLIENDATKSLQVLERRIQEILNDRVDIDDFVLSKSLKGTYASENVPHVQAWQRMKARGDPGCPEKGGRMPIIVVDPYGPQEKMAPSKVPLYLRTEHPDFVKKSGGHIRLCKSYYLEGLQETIERLYSPTRWKTHVHQIFEKALEQAKFQASKSTTLKDFFKRSREDDTDGCTDASFLSETTAAPKTETASKKKKAAPVIHSYSLLKRTT